MTRDDIREAIEPVVEDHELLLGQMRSLEKVLKLTRDDEHEEEHALAVLDELRHYFLSGLLQHLLEEEQGGFFPAVAELPGGDWKVARLAKEHRELRQNVEDFRSAVTLARYVGPWTRRGILWRLITEALVVLARLRAHAAFENELVRELRAWAAKQPVVPAVPGSTAVA